MKIYISLPITGHNLAWCKHRVEQHKITLEQRGHTVVSPFDVCPETNLTYSQYMSRDIHALMGCDAILLLAGWSSSKGCQLEWQCAQIYGKRVFTHISQIKYATETH